MRNNEETQLLRTTEYEGRNISRGAYICNSDERWLIINSEEQLGTTEIDPAVSRGTKWPRNSVPDCTRIKLPRTYF